MSKSKGNVVNPDELVERYGCDSLRLYELFVGPPEMDAEWGDSGIDGVHRFLKRAWAWVLRSNGNWSRTPSRQMLSGEACSRQEGDRASGEFSSQHRRKRDDGVPERVHALDEAPDRETVGVFLTVLSPFTPHLC